MPTSTGQPSPGNVTYCDQVGDGCLPSQDARAKRTAIAPSFGIAFNAFFKEFVGLAFRWRGIPFKYNTSGTDNNRDGQINSDDRLRQFNNMFSVGVIFTLPPKIKTTD
jgi:hypothetical protein